MGTESAVLKALTFQVDLKLNVSRKQLLNFKKKHQEDGKTKLKCHFSKLKTRIRVPSWMVGRNFKTHISTEKCCSNPLRISTTRQVKFYHLPMIEKIACLVISPF